jgi:hypothetical protein
LHYYVYQAAIAAGIRRRHYLYAATYRYECCCLASLLVSRSCCRWWAVNYGLDASFCAATECFICYQAAVIVIKQLLLLTYVTATIVVQPSIVLYSSSCCWRALLPLLCS